MLDLNMHDYVGLSGVAITLLAYLLLQTGTFKISDLCYSAANAIGSLMIVFSLFFSWNSSAAVIEISWFFISIYGIYRIANKKQTSSDYLP